MINVCNQCGMFRVDKEIDATASVAICPECGYRQRFVFSPLYLVSGASGTGKSTVCQRLLGMNNHVVLLDSDILWQPEFNSPENNFGNFFETWLRMCKNIAQSGRSVVLFGAGVGNPDNIEPRVERRYFSSVNYLALVCDDDVLAERLRQRPAWRAHDASYNAEHQRYNHWFKSRGDAPPVIRLIDTTHMSLEDTARGVASWIVELERNSLVNCG